MSDQTLELVFRQGPYFALLIALGWVFFKFLDRTYIDHKEQIQSLQLTFRQSLDQITNTFGGRLDKIENTLEDMKK